MASSQGNVDVLSNVVGVWILTIRIVNIILDLIRVQFSDVKGIKVVKDSLTSQH